MSVVTLPLFTLVFLAIAASGFTQETGYIAPDNFRLNYEVRGKGLSALVVGSSVYYPRTFSKNLHNHLKMVYLDHRGFVPPNGERNQTDYTLNKILDDMEMARVELGLEKIIVVGHSGHSFMALEYAKKYPQHVSHVVLIGTAPDFGPVLSAWRDRSWEESVDPLRKTAQDEWNRRITDEQLASLPGGQAFIRSYVRNGPHAWYDPYFDSTPLWKGVYVNIDMFNYVWGEVFAEIDIRKDLEKLQAPVFLALGRYDNLVAPPASWEPFRDNFPDLTIRVFEKSGHSPMFEEPDAFDEALLTWLKEKG